MELLQKLSISNPIHLDLRSLGSSCKIRGKGIIPIAQGNSQETKWDSIKQDPNKIFHTQSFFRLKVFSGGKIFFEPKIFYIPKKILGLKNLLGPKILFGPKIFLEPKVFFGSKHFFRPNIFRSASSSITRSCLYVCLYVCIKMLQICKILLNLARNIKMQVCKYASMQVC